MGFISYVVVTGVGAVLAATGVGVPIAGMLGFSAAGPVAGSLAAGAQAYVGNVAAGSVFSTVQALAMAAPVWWWCWQTGDFPLCLGRRILCYCIPMCFNACISLFRTDLTSIQMNLLLQNSSLVRNGQKPECWIKAHKGVFLQLLDQIPQARLGLFSIEDTR